MNTTIGASVGVQPIPALPSPLSHAHFVSLPAPARRRTGMCCAARRVAAVKPMESEPVGREARRRLPLSLSPARKPPSLA
eukprot:scaffold62324_cov66-Phaeocystis_antarctica.AAC.5